MDGGFTNNVPSLDQHTVAVNPFCGESDICPMDDSAHLFHVSGAQICKEGTMFP